ncbi:helix-turn-helix domain-containing protein [Alteraurantiacibacter aquimixticola]|uniref:DUF4019 domain-containing protein n=1 Tax=Alteraurantiacibacter aquimixticola TaxID=2489173 RepID=A0A4T3EWR1_9SPHN|nr:DUF4019 domain-containing protein [Alteraurantiacibacter aquimixticola]TIX48995.1 DUF4019 domain-containing protein [Alteraurantiacibacter aquimixticola]
MVEGLLALTAKEKETLRLVIQGYDAKSMARQLDLSVHTINERLRHARRKLAVTSSREAARMLAEVEAPAAKSPPPNSFAYKPMGDDRPASGMTSEIQQRPGTLPGWIIGGTIIMSLILATLAIVNLAQGSAPATADTHPFEANLPAEQAAAVAQSARDWLALVDAEQWEESWQATGTVFRELNTSTVWAEASEQARGPLGAVETRLLAEVETVPAPPRGYQMVRFRTDFANRSGVIETVILQREDEQWRVVGYWIS